MKKLLLLALSLLSFNVYALTMPQLTGVFWNPNAASNPDAYFSCFKDTSAGSRYALGYAYTSNFTETSAGSGVPNANATNRIRNQFLATSNLYQVTDPYSGNIVDASKSTANWLLGAVNLNIFYNHGGAARQLTIPIGTYQTSATGGIRTQYGLATTSVFTTLSPSYGTNVRIYHNTDMVGDSVIDSYMRVTVRAPNGADLNFYLDCQP